ncbi:hypothetical protein [Porticoccus sp.]
MVSLGGFVTIGVLALRGSTQTALAGYPFSQVDSLDLTKTGRQLIKNIDLWVAKSMAPIQW